MKISQIQVLVSSRRLSEKLLRKKNRAIVSDRKIILNGELSLSFVTAVRTCTN